MVTIYVFSDEDGIPKYIGKAKDLNARIKQHINRDRFRYYWTNFYKWLNEQANFDAPFYVDILEEVPDENWIEREIYWIKHAKDNNFPLLNMTEGGDGNNNQVFTEETKKKMSLSQKGRTHTEATRKILSEKHKGKIVKQETKDKLRAINIGKPCSQIVIDLLSKPIIQYDLNGNFLEEFSSLTKASNYLDCRKSSLSNALKKKITKFKGYIWKYKK